MNDPALLPRYNIAAVPVLRVDRDYFYKAAEILRPIAAGYCLSAKNALPHATLCQFRASDALSALKMTQDFLGSKFGLSLEALHVRPGTAGNAGKSVIEYNVVRDPRLLDFQERVVDAVRFAGVEVLNGKRDDWHPHLTLALTAKDPRGLCETLTPKLFAATPCRIHLGLSDEAGQLLKILDGPQ